MTIAFSENAFAFRLKIKISHICKDIPKGIGGDGIDIEITTELLI